MSTTATVESVPVAEMAKTWPIGCKVLHNGKKGFVRWYAAEGRGVLPDKVYVAFRGEPTSLLPVAELRKR